MKATVKAVAFNKRELEVVIELYLDGTLLINSSIVTNSLLPTAVYSSVQEKVLSLLNETFPELSIISVDFNLISRDLENLKKVRIKPDSNELVSAIFTLIEAHLGDTLQDKEKFQKRFLYLDNTPENKTLSRSFQLFYDKKYTEATNLLSSLDMALLTKDEADRVKLLQFEIVLKQTAQNSMELERTFDEIIRCYRDNPAIAKQYYFHYIKFLEDCREPKKPRTHLEEFEQRYPLSILSGKELTFYYYLKGRAEYLRGEFLNSLNLLTKAFGCADENNQKFIAAIYNTSVNSFTDNLFFEEAEIIANRAFKIRELLDLPEKLDTMSCIAGLSFKRGNYVAAFEKYKEVETQSQNIALTDKEKNRLYNYIAKSAIMNTKYDIAREYLEKAEKFKVFNGFSNSLKLLMLLKEKKYDEMQELFRATIMLPENHLKYDSFPLGWSYAFMALSSFEKEEYKDGVIYLARSVDFFLRDLYVLEAFYIILYLYSYSVPSQHIEFFRRIESKRSVSDQLAEYVEKHAVMSQKFFSLFKLDKPNKESNRLEEFYDVIKDIDDDNYNPDEVASIMKRICLM